MDLAATYSPAPCGAVPWALRGFTAEFGMGSGGAPALSATRSGDRPPGSGWDLGPAALLGWSATGAGLGWWQVGMGMMRLSLLGVEVDRAIRTGQLSASPRLHIRPIDVVVCHGPDSETWSCGGFPA